jgi:hypothetical protein
MGKCDWCDRFSFRLQDALCHSCWLDSLEEHGEPEDYEEYEECEDREEREGY